MHLGCILHKQDGILGFLWVAVIKSYPFVTEHYLNGVEKSYGKHNKSGEKLAFLYTLVEYFIFWEESLFQSSPLTFELMKPVTQYLMYLQMWQIPERVSHLQTEIKWDTKEL